jgi:nucleoside-diphosphate kinase
LSKQQTLVLLKPDAVQRGLVGEILSRLEKKGLKLIGLKMLHMNKNLAESHYAQHQGKTFFEPLIAFITSSPLIAVVVEGEEAIDVVRRLMGETDPIQAVPGTIRGDYGLNIEHNLIHGSDTEESAAKEIALFFTETEIFPYQRELDKWIG